MSQTWKKYMSPLSASGACRDREPLWWENSACRVIDTASFLNSCSLSVIVVQTGTSPCCFTCSQTHIWCYFHYLLSVSLEIGLWECVWLNWETWCFMWGNFIHLVIGDSRNLTGGKINIIHFFKTVLCEECMWLTKPEPDHRKNEKVKNVVWQ